METTGTQTGRQGRGRAGGELKRVKDVNTISAREILQLAYLSMEPAERTQRQAFQSLMPELNLLRTKGFSFEQIATYLSECGFTLQVSTVRTYFSEFLAATASECAQKMNEQILLMAEVRKETRGVDFGSVAKKAAEISGRVRKSEDVASKVDSIFGIGVKKATKGERVAETRSDTDVVRLQVSESAAALSPALPVSSDTKSDEGTSFFDNLGLMIGKPEEIGSSSEGAAVSPKAGFADDDAPGIPNIGGSEVDDAKGGFKVLELQSGIESLPRRNDVLAEVYEDGLLEHPAIPGVWLTRAERVYGAYLEFTDLNGGEIRVETAAEKRMRVKWQKPVTMKKTATQDSFVQIDSSLFGNKGHG